MRLLGLLLLSSPVWACSCASWPSPREAWDDSPLVFIGRVEDTKLTEAPSEQDFPRASQVASVRVEKAFKGVEPGQKITLHQPVSSCSAFFRGGEHMLFYLHPAKEPEAWVAEGCHRSRPVSSAADDLLFLEALPGSLKRSRLSGEVELFQDSPTEGFRRQRALAGVHVTVTSEAGAVTRAITNADGVYEIYGLPPGVYKVGIEAPPKMRVSFPMSFGRQNSTRGKRQGIKLAANGGSGVSFVLRVDNRMSGRVLDPDGKPMRGVCVSLEPALATRTDQPSRISGCSKDDGEFKLEEMPPGKYLLVANRSGMPTGASPFGRVYFPGAAGRKQAAVVTIGEGEHLENLDIRIPELKPRIRISGRLEFSDGAPLVDRIVDFAAASSAYREHAVTKDDGSFQLTILAGVPGEIRSEITILRRTVERCPDFRATLVPNRFIAILSPPPVSIDASADQDGVRLTFPFPSCKDFDGSSPPRKR